MKIYKCFITEDEMFSDSFKITESENGILYKVEGKRTTRTEDFDERSIGANASAEEASEGTEASSVSGVDIVLNHRLQETGFNKKSFLIYIKDYVKAIKARLQETNPDRVEAFTAGVKEEVKKIMSNLDNYQFFTGASSNPDGAVGLLDYLEDGTTPFMLFFKDGLVEEKF